MSIIIRYTFAALRRFREAQTKMDTRIDKVIDAYVHALIARYPRARYVVGNDANFILAPTTVCMLWSLCKSLIECSYTV